MYDLRLYAFSLILHVVASQVVTIPSAVGYTTRPGYEPHGGWVHRTNAACTNDGCQARPYTSFDTNFCSQLNTPAAPMACQDGAHFWDDNARCAGEGATCETDCNNWSSTQFFSQDAVQWCADLCDAQDDCNSFLMVAEYNNNCLLSSKGVPAGDEPASSYRTGWCNGEFKKWWFTKGSSETSSYQVVESGSCASGTWLTTEDECVEAIIDLGLVNENFNGQTGYTSSASGKRVEYDRYPVSYRPRGCGIWFDNGSKDDIRWNADESSENCGSDGFSCICKSNVATTTTTTTTTTLGPLCGVFSCGDDAMLKPLMNTEVGSNFDTCCECSYAASNHAFLGMFMKGEFDNQSRKLSLSFDLPSDVQIQSVDWNGASDDTLSYASGLWTSSTVNQCRNTYVLNEGLGDIFGSGSLFSLSGTTLTTSIRVSATSEITEDGSTFERSYSEDIPILVGLETETTVQATFHMTMTEGELVHITGNAEHFATDGTVKLTMMVTTPGCIQNSASIASGMQHLTDPEFTFGEANLVDNLCEQEVSLTFNPIEEFADQISIQFTSRQGVDFQIEVDVNIQAGSILDYLPFDAVMTFHAEPTFSDDPQAEFLLGAEVYAKIELSPLVNLPLSSITVNSFTLTQTGYSGELETTDLMNEGWAGFSYTATPEQNQIAAEFELESTHFHVTEEGELCEVDTDISIVYQDGTTVRRQLSMRRRLTTQQVSNGFAITEAAESESMVAEILKRKTPAMKSFFIFAFFFTASILIFRAYAATKQDEYASLLSADYDEF